MMTSTRQCKGVILVSGGADSILATHLLRRLGVELLALNFKTCFCSCRPGTGCGNALKERFEKIGVPLQTIFLGEDYLRMLARPRFGYGKGMNPCIDCHIMMLRRGSAVMRQTGAAFVATGEVVGQRPMSQLPRTLRLIERESGLLGRLLRPLSAKLLPPSMPELEGLFDRAGLGAFQGRSRRPQIALARELGIDELPGASGGCILTQKSFSGRVRDLFAHAEGGLPDMLDAMLLRLGRHFRLGGSLKVVLGKDKEENDNLFSVASPEDILARARDTEAGPTALVRGEPSHSELVKLAALVLGYADVPEGLPAFVRFMSKSRGAISEVEAMPMSRQEAAGLQL